ncbi:MAG: type II toxin-antitoxin system RelE/ParE family toxin [Burkholderiales bacterium]|nr:MAG: type II toxin-antitoxin system RelE/ParE family toxin [Burkholderiales bacterium]
MKLLKTDAAQNDLIDIWASIAVGNPSAAYKLLDAVEVRLQILPAFLNLALAR